MTSNNSENADFEVIPSLQTNILTSNPRINLVPAQNHRWRPNIFATENYLRNYNPLTVPGYSSYATVSKFGHRHVKRIKRLDFNKELCGGKAFFRSSSGANSDDKPDVVLLHICTNDIPSNVSDTELANNIINIGLNCKNHGVSKVFVSSKLVKKNPKLNPVIQQATISYVNFVK